MGRNILTVVLFAAAVFVLCGCGKVGVKEPVFLPFLAETFGPPEDDGAIPKFDNGDIVKYKMLDDKQGIMMNRRYKYVPDLRTWYCVVDFYPSSALFHFDFSDFDNYERRYVYEFELELIRKYHERRRINKRWNW